MPPGQEPPATPNQNDVLPVVAGKKREHGHVSKYPKNWLGSYLKKDTLKQHTHTHQNHIDYMERERETEGDKESKSKLLEPDLWLLVSCECIYCSRTSLLGWDAKGTHRNLGRQNLRRFGRPENLRSERQREVSARKPKAPKTFHATSERAFFL